MTTPYFTIIIPTRNRSQFILDTVLSAASQDFEDFEVIVSDNSSDDKTREVLAACRQGKEVRYIKPPTELSMPDHWEFATLQARGKYVLVLTDRSVLRQGALGTIYRLMANCGMETVHVCSWSWALFDDEQETLISGAGDLGNATGSLVASPDVASMFVGPQKEYPYSLPRALNSCYSAEIAASIRARHGKLFLPINPDFTSAFLLLGYVDNLLYIDTPLFISRGLLQSNGGNAYKTDGTAYMRSLNIADWYGHVPIKAAFIESMIFEDFLMVKEMAGGTLLKVEMDWVEYFVRCHNELQEKKRVNVLDRSQIGVLQDEWNGALKSMDDDIRYKVGDRLRKSRLSRAKDTLRSMPFMGVIRKLRASIKPAQQNVIARLPTTVLEAAGHKARYEGKL